MSLLLRLTAFLHHSQSITSDSCYQEKESHKIVVKIGVVSCKSNVTFTWTHYFFTSLTINHIK